MPRFYLNLSAAPAPRMHTIQTRNILEIDEILRTFLRWCDKPTLACLARTAKFFSDPALDILWENLESFAHLLKVFPEGLITWEHVPPNGPIRATVNHLIVPRDWKRVSLYAQRVRTWGPEDLSYVEEPLVDHIAFGRNPGYILPRLTHMEVTATSVSGVHLQTLMLCPTLESVSIWNPDPNTWAAPSMLTFFRTLADRAPKLNKFIVHWGNTGGAVTEHFVEGLSDLFSHELVDLKSVNLWTPKCLDAKGFSRLAQLPNLTTLHLNLLGSIRTLVSQIEDNSTAFVSLQNLFLAGETEEFHKVVKCFGNNAPSMVSLGFSVHAYPQSQELQHLFEIVASKFCSLRLLQFNVPKQEISVDFANRLYNTTPELYYHDMSVLQPLLTMRNLAAVHLEIGVPFYLTDMDLFALGAAWPTIEVLNLCSDPYCERARAVRPPAATIIGLLAIAEACPSLQHLGLFLDCSTAITEGMIASAPVASHALINLDVGRSHVLEPPLVAALLSGVFPNLKVFQWAGMDASEGLLASDGGAGGLSSGLQEGYAPGWRQVFDLLPVFRAVRASERRERGLVDSSADAGVLSCSIATAGIEDGRTSMVVD
ncbi:hypothetical protein ACEPAH_2809 [Sanghuangporus vaninii]